MKLLLKRLLNTFGYDIVQVPYPDSLGRKLSDLLRKESVNVVFDVGAHHGEFAMSLRRIGYSGHIHSFEPVADSFSVLQSRASRDQSWFVHHLALGAAAGNRQIHVTCGSAMASFLNSSSYGSSQFERDSQVIHDEEVSVARLDAIFLSTVQGIEAPHCYLKLDTQGWDLEVMEGAKGCLQAICAMQSELSLKPIYDGMPTYLESLETLVNMGFSVAGMFAVKHDSSGAMIEVDCLFINTKAAHLQGTGTL